MLSALDSPTYPDDKIKFINENDYDDSKEELFNRETTLQDIPESFIVELHDVAQDPIENVMIKSNVNEAITTPTSIYDFQGKLILI